MISFVVPAHNEEAWIGRCISAIHTSARAASVEFELIVVDDASADATATIAREQGASVVEVSHQQISATRNTGARQARGDILFFVDADTLVNTAVIREAFRVIDEGAVGGGCVPLFEGGLPLWARAIYPLVIFSARYLLRQTGGACLFCTRQAFEVTGGFSEAHYAAEEDVWVKALKRHGRFVVLDEPVVTSSRSLRMNSFWTIARVLLRLVFRGADGFRDRAGLEIWYQPKRE